MIDLAAAAALVATNPKKALPALITIWTKRPLPRLADAIDSLDAMLGKPWGVLFPDKQVLRARGTRIAKLAKQPRDPRFAHALCTFVRDMPFTSTSSRAFWLQVFAVLAKLDDPRVIVAITEARAGWNIRRDQRTWLEVQSERLLASYRERYPDGAPRPIAREAALLTRIERAIAAATPAAGDTRRHDGLLAAVYAEPDDDAVRAVYADHLTECGDLRGELITLQLLSSPSPAQLQRVARLLAAHEREWIGPLEPVIAKEGVEFERGFMVGCRVKLRNAMDVDKYGKHPSWATVERLRFTGSRFAYQAFSAQASGVFFVDPAMKSLRDVNLHDQADLAMLLALKMPLRIERLVTSTEVSLGRAGLAALAKTAKLPALAAIEMMAPPRGWLTSATFGKRLREVVLGLGPQSDARGPAIWIAELERLPALQHATLVASRLAGTSPRWTFTRDAAKKLSIATLATTPESFDLAVAGLASLPATQLTALSIKVGKARHARTAPLTPAQRAAMTAAITRQTRVPTPVRW